MRGLRSVSLRRMCFSSSSEQVLLRQDGLITRITMNRPEVHNAFNEHVIHDLTHAFKEASGLASSGKSRVVVFTGEGKSFSAGADLAWMKKMASYSHEENKQDSLLLFELFLSLRQCPVPIIAKVNGAAMGGGAGLVAASDIAIGLETAQFGFTEVKLGLIPAVISPFVIEKIGRGMASRYFLTGERFGASEAFWLGLLHETSPTLDSLNARVEELAKEISQNSPAAMARCKKLIQTVGTMDYNNEETKRFVAGEIASIRVSKQGQEGLSAFFEKRPPRWD